MTLSVEVRRRLDLQLGSLQIAVDRTAALQLQQILDLDGTSDLSHDVSLLSLNIALYISIGADNHPGGTIDIAYQGTIDTQITIAGDITFHSRTGAYQAGTRAYRGGPDLKGVRFCFSVKHNKYGF